MTVDLCTKQMEVPTGYICKKKLKRKNNNNNNNYVKMKASNLAGLSLIFFLFLLILSGTERKCY